jgi:hypothetical protein
MTLLDVRNRDVERALCNPHGARADDRPHAFEDLHGNPEPGARCAHDGGVRDEAVLKKDLARRDGGGTHLLLEAPNTQALRPTRDEKALDPARRPARLELRVHGDDVGDIGQRDEALLAIERVSAGGLARNRADARRVGSRDRLGHRHRAAQLPGRNARQILLPLLVVAGDEDRQAAEGLRDQQ